MAHSSGNVSRECPGMNQVVLMLYFSNILRSLRTPTVPANRPSKVSKTPSVHFTSCRHLVRYRSSSLLRHNCRAILQLHPGKALATRLSYHERNEEIGKWPQETIGSLIDLVKSCFTSNGMRLLACDCLQYRLRCSKEPLTLVSVENPTLTLTLTLSLHD